MVIPSVGGGDDGDGCSRHTDIFQLKINFELIANRIVFNVFT